jgi:hypothetical protein
MVLEHYKSSFQIFFIGVLLYVIQKMAFVTLGIDTTNFRLSLEKTYALLLLLSVIILTILNVVFQKNKDVVGMTFLLITTIKVIVISIIGKAYIIPGGNPVEKWNFFGLFVLFLFLETYITGKRLNNTKF